MGKKIVIFFVLCMVFLVSCSSNEKEDAVKIIMPASMFEGQDADDVIKEAEKQDIEAKKNEDGTYTYIMSKKKHDKMMEEFKSNITDSIKEIKSSENYMSIKDISHNPSYSEFTMVVDREAYENSMEGFASFTLGMTGLMYQLYDGVNEEDYHVKVTVKDQKTKEIFAEKVYPEDDGETKS